MKNCVKKELESFRNYKSMYTFKQKEIIEIDGNLYCDNYPLIDENGKDIGECDNWINVGYKIHGAYSKALSNLFPYEFYFRGKLLNSIESFFQGIKFQDKTIQDLIFKYSGTDAVNLKIASNYNWKESGIIYWQGEPINRDSEEYAKLIDELYICAIQNPLYRNVLKNCNKYILHSLGKNDKNDTVFTRYEFELQLNCLKDFLKREY